VPHIQELVSTARQAHVPVIFTKGYEDVKFRGKPGFRRAVKWQEQDGDGSVNSQSGTWGAELYEGIEPQEGDIVVEKHKWSAFDGKDKEGKSLDDILKERGIQTLVLTGVVTETCVHSTAQEAFNRDYFVVVPKDAVGSNKPDQQLSAKYTITILKQKFNNAYMRRKYAIISVNEHVFCQCCN
jgi:ureidoacrylate peracid hydrolase